MRLATSQLYLVAGGPPSSEGAVPAQTAQEIDNFLDHYWSIQHYSTVLVNCQASQIFNHGLGVLQF